MIYEENAGKAICDLRSQVEPMYISLRLWVALTNKKYSYETLLPKVLKDTSFLFYPTTKDVGYVYSVINTKIISLFSVKNDRLVGINTLSQNVVSPQSVDNCPPKQRWSNTNTA